MIYFVKCLFKSAVNSKLDFEETRFINVLKTTSRSVEITLLCNAFSSLFILPDKPIKAIKIPLKQFKGLLNSNTQVFLYSETISSVYLKDLEIYNPKFNYLYSKMYSERV